MTKERRFKKQYGKELIKVAEGDLEVALALAGVGIKRKENIFFSIQQTIEKALKAYLVWLELPVPMVHDLAIIIDRFPESIVIPHAEDLQDLTQFATIRRYEEGSFELTDEETKAALEVAEKILALVKKSLA